MIEVRELHAGFNIESKNSVLALVNDIKDLSDNILNNPKYTIKVLALINKYGGKTASIIWQYINGNFKYLIPFNILDARSFNASNHYESKGYDEFFRASATGDENGLVGMLKSLKSGMNRYSGKIIKPRDIIEEVIRHGDLDLIRKYAELYDCNENYNGIDSILISPNIEEEFGKYTFGSITKHPDFEDIYIINTDSGRAQCLVDSTGKIHKIIGFYDRLNIIKANLDEIIQMKLETDSVGFINGMTTQTEFAIISDKQKKRLNKISRNYEFNSKLNSNIVFLQQREFRKDLEKKVDQNTLEDWSFYEYNIFGEQSVFKQRYREVDLLDLVELSPNINDLPKDEKIILKVTTINYRLLKSNPNSFGILKNPRIVGVIINNVQSEGFGSIEHDTYRIINNDLPIKVVKL